MKNQTKSYLIKKCDTIFSTYWRKKIGKCEKCGKRNNLQLAHIISRDCKKLRWDRDNTFVLCAGCHLFWAHKKPLEFAEFVKLKKGAGLYKYLLKSSNILKPLDLKWYKNKLESLKKLSTDEALDKL